MEYVVTTTLLFLKIATIVDVKRQKQPPRSVIKIFIEALHK